VREKREGDRERETEKAKNTFLISFISVCWGAVFFWRLDVCNLLSLRFVTKQGGEGEGRREVEREN
jgi:hypothetical protein